MAGKKKNPAQTAATRQAFLEKAYELFSARDIASVSMVEIAKESGYGTITLYRYFGTKPILVIAVAVWKWEEFFKINRQRRPSEDFSGMTGLEMFTFFLDSFLRLYKEHQDMLRFNQFFNIYVVAEGIDPEDIEPYRKMIEGFKSNFHEIYEKGRVDQTLRTDVSEEEMFSASLHLMMAAVTRYAVGLVYVPNDESYDRKELQILKEMLIDKYKGK